MRANNSQHQSYVLLINQSSHRNSEHVLPITYHHVASNGRQIDNIENRSSILNGQPVLPSIIDQLYNVSNSCCFFCQLLFLRRQQQTSYITSTVGTKPKRFSIGSASISQLVLLLCVPGPRLLLLPVTLQAFQRLSIICRIHSSCLKQLAATPVRVCGTSKKTPETPSESSSRIAFFLVRSRVVRGART